MHEVCTVYEYCRYTAKIVRNDLLLLLLGCIVGQNNFTWRECSFGLQEYEHQILLLG
jgi:hypothetical protein